MHTFLLNFAGAAEFVPISSVFLTHCRDRRNASFLGRHWCQVSSRFCCAQTSLYLTVAANVFQHQPRGLPGPYLLTLFPNCRAIVMPPSSTSFQDPRTTAFGRA